MTYNFTAVVFQADPSWWVAFAEEMPGANTQGKTKKEALENLEDAVQISLEYHRSKLEEDLPAKYEKTSLSLAA